MVQIGQNGAAFDAGSIEPNTTFDPLPPGWYAMKATGSEWKETKAGPHQLVFTLEIDETYHPEFKGRRVWERLNLQHPKAQVVEIAQRSLSAFSRATGVTTWTDTDQLHGITVAVKVAVRPAKDGYDASNEPKGYDAVSVRLGGSSAPSPGASAPAPADGKAPWAP